MTGPYFHLGGIITRTPWNVIVPLVIYLASASNRGKRVALVLACSARCAMEVSEGARLATYVGGCASTRYAIQRMMVKVSMLERPCD